MKETKNQSTSRKQKLVNAIHSNHRDEFRTLFTDDYVDNARHVLGSIMDEAIDAEAGWAAGMLVEAGLNRADQYAVEAVERESPGVVLSLAQHEVKMDRALQLAVENKQNRCITAILQQEDAHFQHLNEKHETARRFYDYAPGDIREFLANDGFEECAFFDSITDEPGSLAFVILKEGLNRATAHQLQVLLYDYADEPRESYVQLCRYTRRWLHDNRWWEEPRESYCSRADRGVVLRSFFETVLEDSFALSGEREAFYRDARLLTLFQQNAQSDVIRTAIQNGANPFGTVTTDQTGSNYAPVAALTGQNEQYARDVFEIAMEETDDETIKQGLEENVPDLHELCVRREQGGLLFDLLSYDIIDLDAEKAVSRLVRNGRVDVANDLLDNPNVNQANLDYAGIEHNNELLEQNSDGVAELFGYLKSEKQEAILAEVAQRGQNQLLRNILDQNNPDAEAMTAATQRALLNHQPNCVEVLIDDTGRESILLRLSNYLDLSVQDNPVELEQKLYIVESFIESFGAPENEQVCQELFKNIIKAGLTGSDADRVKQAERSVIQTLQHMRNRYGVVPDGFDGLYDLLLNEREYYQELFRTMVRWQPPSPEMLQERDFNGNYRHVLREELSNRQKKRLEAEGIDLSRRK